MRALWVAAAVSLTVLATIARAEQPKLPPGSPPLTVRPNLDGLKGGPPLLVQPNCGDPVPFDIGWRGLYATPGLLHMNFSAVVKNVGTQPSGGATPFQFITVTQRLTGYAEEQEILRANFRPLRAGESQSFPFEMRFPLDKYGRPVWPGAWTLTMSLSYTTGAPVTLRPADCVMTDNVLVRNVRFW